MLFPLYLWSAQYALLVGSSNGGDGVAQLRYVKSDLIAMKQVLVDHCRYAPDRIAILKDGTPEELKKYKDVEVYHLAVSESQAKIDRR